MRRYVLCQGEAEARLLNEWNVQSNRRKAYDVLCGIALGFLADGEFSDQEARFLVGWLERNASDLSQVLLRRLMPIIRSAALSHPLSEAQLAEFSSMLFGIATGEPEPSTLAPERHTNQGTPRDWLFDDLPPAMIRFAGSEFVVTGEFRTAKRKDILALISRKGAIARSAPPNAATSYLVVGEVGSEAWAYSGLGRKIEKALEMKDSGLEIAIIREQTLLDALALNADILSP